MILGLGNDMVDIRRIEHALEHFGTRFELRVFTDSERKKARSNPTPRTIAGSFAKRFAAKEACAKALGIGIQQGVYLRDMEVLSGENGQPTLLLHGGAAARLETLLPAGKTARLHLTLTDEYPLALAHVIIEAI